MTIDTSRCDVIVLFLILCCFAGCARDKGKAAPRNPEKHPQLQILASRQRDAKIVRLAEKENETIVKLDGDVVARWVELGVEDLADDKDVVVQEGKDKKKRRLVLVGESDLSVKHFEHLYGGKDADNDPAVNVQLSDEGARRIRVLTYTKNTGLRIGGSGVF